VHNRAQLNYAKFTHRSEIIHIGGMQKYH
jgi:hypothetical protein